MFYDVDAEKVVSSVILAYFKDYDLVRHQTESFNMFITQDIREMVQETPEINILDYVSLLNLFYCFVGLPLISLLLDFPFFLRKNRFEHISLYPSMTTNAYGDHFLVPERGMVKRLHVCVSYKA